MKTYYNLRRSNMILDVTGVYLVPSHDGKECPENGTYKDSEGCVIECCCEECSFFLCCFDDVLPLC